MSKRRGPRGGGTLTPLLNLASKSAWRHLESNCHYCQVPLKMHRRTKDHVVPVYRGGPDAPDNYVVSCGACNHRKGNDRSDCSCGICATAWRKYGPPKWELLQRAKISRR